MGKDAFCNLSAIAGACCDTQLFIVGIYSLEGPNFLECNVDYYNFKSGLSSNRDFSTFDVIVLGGTNKWVAALRGLAGGVLAAHEQLLPYGEPCGSGFQKWLNG